jgi:hypothetical protein
MCRRRKKLLDDAFKKLDYNKDGFVDVGDLKFWYKKSNKSNLKLDSKKIDQVIKNTQIVLEKNYFYLNI